MDTVTATTTNSNVMFRPTAEHRLILKHPQDNDRGLVFLIQL